MTEEYKKELLNYVLGKLDDKSPKNEPLIKQVSKISNGMEDFIKQYYPELGSRWDVSTLLTRGDYIITIINDYFWGEDVPIGKLGRWKKTFIVVMDKNYSPVKFIDSYSSGTLFNMFSNLNTDDDGAGNIYITDTIFNDDFTINRRRVLIINDFTLTDFEVRLLNSYDVPKYNNKIINVMQLTKNVSEGKYFMIYSDSDSSGGALEFVNNVGSENEWNFYPYTGSKNIKWYGFQKGVATWTDDKLNFKIFCDYEISPDNNNNSIAFVTLKNSEGEVKTTIDDKSFNLPSECKNVGQMVGLSITGNKALLEAISTKPELDKTGYIIEYNLDTADYSIRYAKEDYIYNVIDDHTYESSSDSFELFQVNGQLYFIRNYKYYRNIHNDDWSISNDEYFNNDLYLYQIFDDEVFEFYIKDLEQEKNTDYQLAISNLYNLYEFGLIFQKYIINIKEIFNNFNYNGYPNNSKNCLVPNSVELYSNSDLVFARNIHNISINDNFTISSVEIPNNYLNDIDLTCKNLISKTNLKMIDDKKIFNKNIYENVFLNFINSIQVINKIGNQHIVNNLASSGLNSAVNTTNQYDKMKLYSKAILYYQDSTTKEITFEVKRLSELSADLFLAFKLDKYADKIEFVSNDKTIIYHTIDLSNLETEKTYSLKQSVEIDFERNYATANGSSISIQDSVYARFKEISIDGALKQETTKGNQLLDISSMNADAGITSEFKNDILTIANDGTIAYQRVRKNIKELFQNNPGKTVCFNYENLESEKTPDGTILQIAIYYNDGTATKYIALVTKSFQRNSYTIPTNISNVTSVIIAFFPSNNQTPMSNTLTITKPMLYFGDLNNPPEYEEYTGMQASPNPDYPQPIKVLEGNLDLEICNKNLCPTDFNDWESGQYGANGSKQSNTTRIRLKNLIRVTSNQSYYVDTYSNRNFTFIFRAYDKNKEFVRNIAIVGDKESFNTNANEYFISVTIGQNTNSQLPTANFEYYKEYFENETIKPFICLNSEKNKTYELHQSNKYSFGLKNEFVAKLSDDIKDELYTEYDEQGNCHAYLKKKIGKAILNGSEDWRTSIAATDFYRYTTLIDSYISSETGPVFGKNTHFFQRVNQAHGEYEYLYLINNDFKQLGCYIQSQNFTTLEEFKTWLSTNNVEVYYELANPYIVDLGIVEMPFSYNPTTNIFTTSSLQPNMRVTYCTNKEKEESDNYEYFK